MLIIFDLGDTLIDTSGSITPYAIENALHSMIAAGLQISSIPEALELLQRIDKTAVSGKAALAEFIEITNGNAAHLEAATTAYANSFLDVPVFPLEGAVDVLLQLAHSHCLVMVTCGKLSVQMEKLKKAGIDSALFSKIIVSEDGNKKIHYQKLMEEFECVSTAVLVCGDRIPLDLAPAKDLGFSTVHMKWGRGLNTRGRRGDVDYQIDALKELIDIVSHVMTFSTF